MSSFSLLIHCMDTINSALHMGDSIHYIGGELDGTVHKIGRAGGWVGGFLWFDELCKLH